MLGAIRRRTAPPLSRVADLVSHLEGKVQGSLLDVLTAVDSAKVPLADQFEPLVKSRVGAKALALKALNLLVAKHHFQAK